MTGEVAGGSSAVVPELDSSTGELALSGLLPHDDLIGGAYVLRARVVLPVDERSHLRAAVSDQARRLGIQLTRVSSRDHVRRQLQAASESAGGVQGALAVFDAFSTPFVVLDGTVVAQDGVQASFDAAVAAQYPQGRPEPTGSGPDGDSSGGLSTGAIAGIAVGIGLAVLVTIAVYFLAVRRGAGCGGSGGSAGPSRRVSQSKPTNSSSGSAGSSRAGAVQGAAAIKGTTKSVKNWDDSSSASSRMHLYAAANPSVPVHAGAAHGLNQGPRTPLASKQGPPVGFESGVTGAEFKGSNPMARV